MPQDLQYQVLEFARNLTKSKIKGVPGKELRLLRLFYGG